MARQTQNNSALPAPATAEATPIVPDTMARFQVAANDAPAQVPNPNFPPSADQPITDEGAIASDISSELSNSQGVQNALRKYNPQFVSERLNDKITEPRTLGPEKVASIENFLKALLSQSGGGADGQSSAEQERISQGILEGFNQSGFKDAYQSASISPLGNNTYALSLKLNDGVSIKLPDGLPAAKINFAKDVSLRFQVSPEGDFQGFKFEDIDGIRVKKAWIPIEPKINAISVSTADQVVINVAMNGNQSFNPPQVSEKLAKSLVGLAEDAA
jgi:hypothetical protein